MGEWNPLPTKILNIYRFSHLVSPWRQWVRLVPPWFEKEYVFLNIHMFVSKCNRTPGWNLTRVHFVLFLSQTQRNQRPSSGDWGTGGQVNLPLWAVIFFLNIWHCIPKQNKKTQHAQENVLNDVQNEKKAISYEYVCIYFYCFLHLHVS